MEYLIVNISIFKTLETIKNRNPILVETGCGASTIAMFLYCVLNNGHLYPGIPTEAKVPF